MKLRVILLFALLSWCTCPHSLAGSELDPDADYDRLDGQGRSGKTVNVVEWEGNLEIHVYPENSLIGLSAKIDMGARGSKVMVLGYRMNSEPNVTLIRRAILGVPFQAGFQAWKDSSAEGYDKIILSNRPLKGPRLKPFPLEPEPKQLYPDGHPALKNESVTPNSPKPERRKPAANSNLDKPLDGLDPDTGSIRPFGVN